MHHSFSHNKSTPCWFNSKFGNNVKILFKKKNCKTTYIKMLRLNPECRFALWSFSFLVSCEPHRLHHYISTPTLRSHIPHVTCTLSFVGVKCVLLLLAMGTYCTIHLASVRKSSDQNLAYSTQFTTVYHSFVLKMWHIHFIKIYSVFKVVPEWNQMKHKDYTVCSCVFMRPAVFLMRQTHQSSHHSAIISLFFFLLDSVLTRQKNPN